MADSIFEPEEISYYSVFKPCKDAATNQGSKTNSRVLCEAPDEHRMVLHMETLKKFNDPNSNVEDHQTVEPGTEIEFESAMQEFFIESGLQKTSATLSDFTIDLNKGGGQIERDVEGEHISLLLEHLVKENKLKDVDFVCKRGLLTKILKAPVCDSQIQVIVQKHGNILYLRETDKRKPREEKIESQPDYGRRFESYVSAKKGKEPEPQRPMDCNQGFYTVNRMRVTDADTGTSHSIIFNAEVDSCLSKQEQIYVELKTRKESGKNADSKVLLKWWLQSALVGTKHIVCGVHKGNRVITMLEWYKVSEIPSMIDELRSTKVEDSYAKPEDCHEILSTVLSDIKKEVEKVKTQKHLEPRGHHKTLGSLDSELKNSLEIAESDLSQNPEDILEITATLILKIRKSIEEMKSSLNNETVKLVVIKLEDSFEGALDGGVYWKPENCHKVWHSVRSAIQVSLETVNDGTYKFTKHHYISQVTKEKTERNDLDPVEVSVLPKWFTET